MQFENIATPGQQTPQIRYARLHRIIEQGLASVETWAELTRVCIALNLRDEALQAFDRIEHSSHRHPLHNLLVQQGLLERSSSTTDSGRRHADVVEMEEERSTVKDHCRDAVQFLFQEHMPLLVVIATVTFPLVVGLGGFLTQDSGMFLLPLIAFLPGLSVLAILGGMGRRILREASRGLEDPPAIPDLRTLGRESARFSFDFAALSAIFLGPGIVAVALGAPITSCISMFILGGMVLPITMALRQQRGDWKVLSPLVLMQALRRGGPTYMGMAGLIQLMFLPAVLAGIASLGAPLYLQISVVGPLAVLPMFAVSRMLGTFLFERRESFADLAPSSGLDGVQSMARAVKEIEVRRTNEQRAERPQTPPPSPSPQPAPKATPAQSAQHRAAHPAASALRQRREQQSQARRPAAPAARHPEARPAPSPRPQQRPAPATPSPRQMAAVSTGARPAPTPKQAAAKAARPEPPRPTAARPTAPGQAPAPNPAANTEETSSGRYRVTEDHMPDFTKMPGFSVMSGEERERAGASRPNRRR